MAQQRKLYGRITTSGNTITSIFFNKRFKTKNSTYLHCVHFEDQTYLAFFQLSFGAMSIQSYFRYRKDTYLKNIATLIIVF